MAAKAKTMSSEKSEKASPKPPPAKGKTPVQAAVAAKEAAPPAKSAPVPAASKATPAAVVTLKQIGVELSEGRAIPKRDVEGLLGAMIESVTDHLKKGARIRIGGLGVLEVKNRAARMGRNPATGAAIEIKASKKIAFRPAKELKEAV